MSRLLPSKWSVLLAVVVLLVAAYLGTALWFSIKPAVPAVEADESNEDGHATVTLMVDLMRAQLDTYGGWLPNDLPPGPGWFVDNKPNFQLGVLQTLRHTSRVLRDNLTRQRTSDAVHKEADLAYSSYANNPVKWAFPSAEGVFERGNRSLERFRSELGDTARFVPRADNLIQLLEIYTSELGAVNSRLLEARTEEVGRLEVDDNLYYAQGVAYAMLGMMRAVEHDFREVIADKNAGEITGLVIESLEHTQFEPIVVTNGSRDGLLANHSYNLQVFLADTRQKMISLITILREG